MGAGGIDGFEQLSQIAIDDMYSSVASYEALSEASKTLLFETLSDIAAHALKALAPLKADIVGVRAKNAVIVVFYMLLTLCHKAEGDSSVEAAAAPAEVKDKADDGDFEAAAKHPRSKKGAKCGAGQWAAWRAPCLQLVHRMVAMDQSKLWSMGVVSEPFQSLSWALALKVLEAKPAAEEVKAVCMNIVSDSVPAFSVSSGSLSSLCARLVDGLMRAEHMAELVAQMSTREQCAGVAKELFAEIAHWNMASLSPTSCKNVGSFLEEFAAARPALMTAFMPLVKHHVDCAAHQIRTSMLRAMGSVVMHIHSLMAQQGEAPAGAAEGDQHGRGDNTTQLARTRDALLDLLVERTHDVSYFTRAAVLKVWCSLLEAQALPLSAVAAVTDVAVDRLQDKTVNVRKNAVGVLTALLDNNPFSGSLDESLFEQRSRELEVMHRERVEVLRANSAPAAAEEDEEEEPSEAARGAAEDPFLLSADVRDDATIASVRARLEHSRCALRLIRAATAAVASVERLIHSNNSSDVVAALRFVTRAVAFNIKGSANVLSAAFPLVWHTDPAVVSEVVSCFYRVYITDGSEEGALLPAAEAARNLVQIAFRCRDSVVSLERIVGEIVGKGLVDSDAVVAALWKMLSDRSGSLGAALHVVSMIAKSSAGVVTPAKVRTIAQLALSKEALASRDFYAMRSACQCIAAVPSYFKSDADMQAALLTASVGLADVALGAFCGDDEAATREWFSACEEAMHALFHSHPCPDKVAASLIAPLYESLSSTNNQEGEAQLLCSAARLSRLLFVLGQTALSALIFAEEIASLAKKAEGKRAPAAVEVPAAKAKKESKESAADSMEEEMGMAAAADAESERLFLHLTERQLVMDNLLGKFHPLLAYIVADQKGRFGRLLVRQAAVLALCRYMAVSSQLCESYLPLLFTTLEREQDDSVRTSAIIALGDLAFRFPNALEPWTGYMYARLGDESVTVRYNALMVLTHLILNDMVKVKGQVSHVVCCLRDECEAVRDLAALFFIKLSERSNNPVYNLLGDIIASLSGSSATPEAPENSGATVVAATLASATPSRALSTADFQKTMTFLLSFVKKDKQADGLLERLVLRIGMAESIGQRRNLAFCVSELQITDKGVKRMTELVKHVKDALYDNQVYECFKSVVAKVKKGRVPGSSSAEQKENKSAVEEFEALMEGIRSGANGEEVAVAAPSASENHDGDGAPKAVKKRAAPKKKVSRRKAADSEEEEEAELEAAAPAKEPAGARKSGRAARRVLGDVSNYDSE